MNSVYLSKIQSNINLLSENVEKTTNQVASGKKFQEGSEDVEAFDLHLQIREDLKIFKDVVDDIAYAQNILRNTEVGIDNIEGLLETMSVSISKMASNATYNTIERGIILEEFQGIKDQMVNIANTQINGQYIYSGTFTERPPFDPNNTQINPETMAEEMVYQGNLDSKEVYVDKDYKKDFSITGQELFVDSGLFAKVDELIRLLENPVLETSKELNHMGKTNNEIVGGTMIEDINRSLQKLDFTQLTVDQKLNIQSYADTIEAYIKTPTIENYKKMDNQYNALVAVPASGGAGPWDYPVELTAMRDLAEYNVSLNTHSQGEKILAEVAVNESWPTGVSSGEGNVYNFDILSDEELNNIKIDLKMFDPEGDVRIAINGVEILELPNHAGTSEITLADLKGEMFAKGANTLEIWSDTGDAGVLESFKVYTASNADVFEEKDSILEKYDALLSVEQKEDIVYQYNMAMYKLDLKTYLEDPTAENLEKMELSKNYINNEVTQEDIEQWKVNQKERYEPIVLKSTALLNTYVTDINGSPDVSLINDYSKSIQDFLSEPTQENFDIVKGLRDTFVASAKTSTVIDPDAEVENMFDYVEYIHNSQKWSEGQVTGELEKTNDYMFNLTKNPFSTKIEDMETVHGNIQGVRGKLGNTYNYLDNMTSKLNSKTLELQKFYSDNVEADMSEVATRLTQETNALNALYSVVAKLQSLSLTNYLK